MLKKDRRFLIIIMSVALIMVCSAAYPPFVFAAGDATEWGMRIGSIVGLLVGSYLMFKVHWIIGILTLIGGIVAIAKM